MRIEGQQEFNRWLIAIGNGTISDGEEQGNDLIEIPQQMQSSGNIVQESSAIRLLLILMKTSKLLVGKSFLLQKTMMLLS